LIYNQEKETTMTEMNIDQFFSDLPNYFLPEKAVGLNTSIQVVLTGDKGGEWVMKIRDQKCTVEKGTMENPALTITADASDFYAIFKGEMDATRAFMMGKIRIQGNMGLAMRLTSLFRTS